MDDKKRFVLLISLQELLILIPTIVMIPVGFSILAFLKIMDNLEKQCQILFSFVEFLICLNQKLL